MEIILDISHEPSLSGERWSAVCKNCQATIGDCCRDIELTLFPDEIHTFMERDPTNISQYNIGTKKVWGYNNVRCCFLNTSDQCELQLKGIPKPIDCLIYPLNYKNGKIFLDSSCPGRSLLDIEAAKSVLREKLKKFPAYAAVRYAIMSSDIELGPVEETGLE